MALQKEDYTNRRGPGEIVTLGNGEYLQAETTADRFIALWSSSLAAPEFFDKVLETLGNPTPGHDAAFVSLSHTRANGERGYGSAQDVMHYAKKQSDLISFMQINFPRDVIITWCQPSARIVGSTAELTEAGMRTDIAHDRPSIIQVIDATASDTLRAEQNQVISHINQFNAAPTLL